jgi:isopenicillin N synthase-like dioxygenase
MNKIGSIQLHLYGPVAELPAHTDMAPLTIIFADAEGLEVELPGGRWEPVPSIGGVLACMLGDMTMHLTNDRYRTAAHRVVRSSRLRHSVLWEPASHPRAVIAPLPQFCSPSEPPRYEPKSFVEITREWIQAKQEPPRQ